MSRKLHALSALTAMLLVSSPCWAMSSVPMPTNSDGTPRFTVPDENTQSHFSGSVQITSGIGGNSYGPGGAATLTDRGPGSANPGNSGLNSPFSNFGFPNSGPSGFDTTDPTFGPHGTYGRDPQSNLH